STRKSNTRTPPTMTTSMTTSGETASARFGILTVFLFSISASNSVMRVRGEPKPSLTRRPKSDDERHRRRRRLCPPQRLAEPHGVAAFGALWQVDLDQTARRLLCGTEEIPAEHIHRLVQPQTHPVGAVEDNDKAFARTFGDVHALVRGDEIVCRRGFVDGFAIGLQPCPDLQKPFLLQRRDAAVGGRTDVEQEVSAAGDCAHEQSDEFLGTGVVLSALGAV